MATQVDPQPTLDMIALANYKSQIDLIINAAIGHHNRTNLIAEGSLGQILNGIAMATVSVSEGVGLEKAANSGLAGQMSALTAAVSNAMQLVKAGQTTPPPTA